MFLVRHNILHMEIEPRVLCVAEAIDWSEVSLGICHTASHDSAIGFREENTINIVKLGVRSHFLTLPKGLSYTGDRVIRGLDVLPRLTELKLDPSRDAQAANRTRCSVEEIGMLAVGAFNYFPIREHHFHTVYSAIEEPMLERATFPRRACVAASDRNARKLHHDRRDQAVLQGLLHQPWAHWARPKQSGSQD